MTLKYYTPTLDETVKITKVLKLKYTTCV